MSLTNETLRDFSHSFWKDQPGLGNWLEGVSKRNVRVWDIPGASLGLCKTSNNGSVGGVWEEAKSGRQTEVWKGHVACKTEQVSNIFPEQAKRGKDTSLSLKFRWSLIVLYMWVLLQLAPFLCQLLVASVSVEYTLICTTDWTCK